MKYVAVLNLSLVLIAASSAESVADAITVPSDLNPGDQYRLAFITSEKTAATSTDIDYYNSFVDGLGDSLLESDWRIIGSTSTIDARDNTGTNPLVEVGVPIYRLDGIRVADNNADLWDGSLQAPIKVNDLGEVINDPYNPYYSVWTGTEIDGLAYGYYSRPLGTTLEVTRGVVGGSSYVWTRFDKSPNIEGLLPVYAISSVLTVPNTNPVPEPSSFAALAGLSAMGLIFMRRRRKKS